ncbi:unnamed protein product, partial [marine sediment metagenome]
MSFFLDEEICKIFKFIQITFNNFFTNSDNNLIEDVLTEQNNIKKKPAFRINRKKKLKDENVRELNRDEIVKNLNGRTLMVYFVILNKKSIGVRELQRQLELSSPSVAKYHLEKLVNMNLVENRNG